MGDKRTVNWRKVALLLLGGGFLLLAHVKLPPLLGFHPHHVLLQLVDQGRLQDNNLFERLRQLSCER